MKFAAYVTFFHILLVSILYHCIYGCAGGKIEKNDVGGACGAHKGGERCAQGTSVETRGKETIGETQTQMGGQY